jgi:hypothetical protein
MKTYKKLEGSSGPGDSPIRSVYIRKFFLISRKKLISDDHTLFSPFYPDKC